MSVSAGWFGGYQKKVLVTGLMVGLHYRIFYLVTQPLSELKEFYIQVPYSAKLFEPRPDLLEIWSEFQGLSGQPYQISITGKPNQMILRFDFPTSRQMAQVRYKSHKIHFYIKIYPRNKS